MDTTKIKDEHYADISYKVGGNDIISQPEEFVTKNLNVNISSVSQKYGKFYGKQFFVHVTDREIVFEIVIRNKYNIANDAGGGNLHRYIHQNDAACILQYIGFDGSDIQEALNFESSDFANDIDHTTESSAQIIHNIGKQWHTPVRLEQTDSDTARYDIVEYVSSTDETNTPAVRYNASHVKSECVAYSGESTDVVEYSDTDFQSFSNISDQFTPAGNNHGEPQLPAHVNKMGALISEMGAHVFVQHPQVSEMDAHVYEMGVLSENGAHDYEMGALISEKGPQLSEMNVDYSERGSHVSEMGAHISEMGAHISERGSQISERGAHISEMDMEDDDIHSETDKDDTQSSDPFGDNKPPQVTKKTRNVKCSECDHVSTSASCLKRHVKYKHTNERSHKCLSCDFECVEASALKRHLQYKHTQNRDFHCSKCTVKCVTAHDLSRHIQYKHSKDRPFRCSLCDLGFVEANDLKKHMVKVHAGVLPFQCFKCSYKCDQHRDLRAHMESHHRDEQLFACSECNHKSVSEEFLKKHIADSHSLERSIIISKRTLQKNLLNKKQTDLEGYKCQECEFVCNVMAKLNKHMQRHTLPYMCHMCSYRTSANSILKDHMLTKHSTARPFVCDECDYKCITLRKLKWHIKVKHKGHQVPKRICPICGLSTSCKLDKHMFERHTGELPFQCPYCSHKCNRECNLKQHIKRRHTQVPV